MTTPGADVVVVGAGCAGLSAAVRLARDGVRVLVLEARSRLGGRATSFADPRTNELVDNGQHILTGCYTETFAFLNDIGASDAFRVQRQLAVTMIDSAGRRSTLTCPNLPTPLHLFGGLLEWDALGWRDRVAALRMAGPLATARRALTDPRSRKIAASPGETVANWLVRNGQTPRITEMLWNPLALAVLNQPADIAAAPPFARVLAEMFGESASAAGIVLPTRPLELAYAQPARAVIEQRGGVVQAGGAARVEIAGDGGLTVEADGQRRPAAAVVVAVPWHALSSTIGGDVAPLAETLANARATAASPIVTVNLWFDRPILEQPFVGLPGRTMQWVFEKRLVFGRDTSHVATVTSGASHVLGYANEPLIDLAVEEMSAAIPQARAARLVGATVIREPRATFSLAPGQPPRPRTETAVPGLFLAGDWIDTGLPATIESAVRSGHRAAALAIAHIGSDGERA